MFTKIKKLIVMSVCVILAASVSADISELLAKVSKYNANTKITIKVIGKNGVPIEGAEVNIGFRRADQRATGEKGVSDINGLFSASGESSGYVSYGVNKDSYYETIESKWILNADGKKEKKDGKWQPWNPTITVVLKKKIKPVPMYAKRCPLGLPAVNEKIGYDLEKGDWVAPHGKGIISDFIFFGELDQRNKKDYDYKLTVTFSNPGDGIQDYFIKGRDKYNPTRGSVLKSSQFAPEKGYLSEWIQTKTRKPGEQIAGNCDPMRNYYFRVRSEVDANGNIIKAMYGKIYGDFLNFIYYLNPDFTRNVEYSGKNLLIPKGANESDKKYNGCRNLAP